MEPYQQTPSQPRQRPAIPSGEANRLLLLVNGIMALLYFSWWFVPSHVGSIVPYSLLFFGELYHVTMALLFWFTVWPGKHLTKPQATIGKHQVTIFITVAGEPESIVAETVKAAKAQTYPDKTIYILNDGFVANKPNWQHIEQLANQLGVHCITRKNPGGAKAGNINQALAKTAGDIIVVFDADMVPHQDFLEKVLPYFSEPRVGFVQTPQYYVNASENDVTAGAWEQQEFFFGPILRGTEKNNATFICGTNFAIRRQALEEAGGMYEQSIAEDFLTSILVHQKGWQSRYVPEVLAQGLAPQDLLSYYKQQSRWARGSLEVLFRANPVFLPNLSIRQRLQYLMFAAYWLNGVIIFIDMVMPLLFLFFGIEPVSTTTTSFALFFLPFMLLNLLTLRKVSNSAFTFRAISFSHASFILQLQSLFATLTRRPATFSVTPKQAQSGNYLKLAYPHILYIILASAGAGVAVARDGINPSVVTNCAWALFNIIVFLPYIKAAINWRSIFKGNFKWVYA